jgi:hypothetical protein
VQLMWLSDRFVTDGPANLYSPWTVVEGGSRNHRHPSAAVTAGTPGRNDATTR